jgi:hypothetical protein
MSVGSNASPCNSATPYNSSMLGTQLRISQQPQRFSSLLSM